MSSNIIDMSSVINPAPQAVYQSERYGNITYSLGSLTANGSYTVRLHFAEIYWTAIGKRVFNVAINGTQVLTNFDIFATTGATNKAIVREFNANADGTGKITIVFTTVTDNAKISGIEILSASPGNNAPTIATAASASPSTVTSATTSLSVLGADDAGESGLSYTWAATAKPAGSTVNFSSNGNNASKNSIATFNRAGSYTLACTISDVAGLTIVSSVNVTVNQTLTTITVSPASASVTTGATQQFSASAIDQFGQPMSTTFAWSVSGGGTINTNGLFTAGNLAGGPFTVAATSQAQSGNASVTVTSISLPVELLDAWTIGTSHIQTSGPNRSLVVLVHGEHNSLNMSVATVTYGGQTMTKVIEKNQGAAARSYVAAFVLNDAGVTAAADNNIAVTWSQPPETGKSDVLSVLLKNVNQSTMTGASAAGGNDNATSASVSSALTTNSGDMAIVGGTGAFQGTFNVGTGYTKGIETTTSTWGDAISGQKSATGINETPSVTISASMRLAVIGFVVKK